MLWALIATHLLGGTQTFEIVPAESALYLQVFRDEEATFSGLSYNHVVRAGTFSGSMSVDPDAPSRCPGRVVVPVASLQNDEPAWRRRVGYADDIGEGDRDSIRETMLGDEVLDVDRFPEITFTSEICVRRGKEALVAGNLTIRGKAKALDVPLALELDDTRLRVKGAVTIRHADFGMEPLTFFLGAVGNAEEMRLHVDLVFKRTPVATP